MRILFYLPVTRHTPVFEWALDMIQKHLDAGDHVTILTCDADAASCEINLLHRRSVCDKCQAKRSDGFQLLAGDFKSASFLKLTAANRSEIAALPEAFEGIDALKNFTFDGADLGMAVVSSVISITREPNLDVKAYAGSIANLLKTAVAVYRSVQNWLAESRFDRVYVFNARVATMRAAFRAARSRDIDCYVYENGSNVHTTQCYVNTLPHSIAPVRQMILDAWARAPDASERDRAARRFFEKTAAGQSTINFVSMQEQGLLPKGFSERNRNIAIYTSSEDEMAAIGDEWKNTMYDSQLAGLQKIRADIDKLPADAHVYVRVHPHLRGIQNQFTRALSALNHPRFTIVPADSTVSSYALLRAADTVMTFGSTIGIEAVFARKPVVLSGAALYRDLKATYNPADHDALIELLGQKLDPMPLEPALQYGYFMETFGEPFKYFKAEGMYNGTFKGRRLTYGRWRDYFWGLVELVPILGRRINRRHLSRALERLGVPAAKCSTEFSAAELAKKI